MLASKLGAGSLRAHGWRAAAVSRESIFLSTPPWFRKLPSMVTSRRVPTGHGHGNIYQWVRSIDVVGPSCIHCVHRQLCCAVFSRVMTDDTPTLHFSGPSRRPGLCLVCSVRRSPAPTCDDENAERQGMSLARSLTRSLSTHLCVLHMHDMPPSMQMCILHTL